MADSVQYKNSVEIWLGVWNIGMLNGKGLEIYEEECRFVLLTKERMEKVYG